MNKAEVLAKIESIVDEVAIYQLEAKKQHSYTVTVKGDGIDYVTDIDKQSEKMIIEGIQKHYPEHSILAEESGVTDTDSDYQWVIDPIDGTTNYVHNYPMHSISVGLKYKGETILGVVDIPAVGMRFTVIKGKGSYLNKERIQVSNTKDLKSSILATGFPYSRKTDNMNLPYFNAMINNVSGIRRSGSAAVDCCFVAAGMVDGYWEFSLNEWDICAGILLIEESGGKVTTVNDQYGIRIVTGNEVIHDFLIDFLENN